MQPATDGKTGFLNNAAEHHAGGLVLLGGASGAGKSYLARTYGRPHLLLDAFYREIAEDSAADGPLPRTVYG